jgi:hypothetical protein
MWKLTAEMQRELGPTVTAYVNTNGTMSKHGYVSVPEHQTPKAISRKLTKIFGAPRAGGYMSEWFYWQISKNDFTTF